MNVPYTALARRFRPQTFSEVVGQGRIATTLRNAILEGRVAHAYLFTGARGVGKTSMARIFAKALNCPNAVDAVPCNDCEICRSIAAGQDVDVSEIDGASNRGIDDIRALRANVNVRSMRSRFKVYIVDEVHMLTKEAFNALLKTLEEPPPGVKFIFCTTEPNKVPDTILSRCQRFDFGTISTQEIRGRLGQLAEAEGFDVDDEALELVARRAAGSMRDSQSLFDQLLAFGSQTISADDVHRLLGTAPDDRLVDLMDVLIQQQPGEALIQLEAALSQGVQLDPFWDQLIAYARDLMITATGAVQLPLMSVSERQRSRLVEQAQAWKLPLILAAMEILSETRQKMQRSTFGRALAELGLVQISRLRELEQLEVLIAELKAGGGTETGPSLPMQARTLPARQVSTASESPQKKNSELAIAPSRGSPTAPRSVEELQVAEESLRTAKLTSAGEDGEGENGEKAPPEIEWDAHCGKKILEALRSRFVDIVGSHLKNVVSTAITGPNQLEFSFPARYDMCRRACERPEVLNDIESAASELTQRRVRIKFRIVEQGPPEKSVKAPPLAPRQRTVEEPDDPLVCEVGRVFGVEAWRLLELGPIARPSVDDHDSDGMAIDALQEDET